MTDIQHPEQAVAVVGLATRVPGAADTAAFWDNLRSGVESVTALDDEALLARGADPSWLSDPRFVRTVVELADVDRFDAGFFGMSPGDAAILDPQHRLFLECCWRALEDAACVPGDGDASIGVYASASLSGYLIGNLLRGRVYDASPDSFRYLLANDKDYLATRVAYTLGLDGPAISVQTACSSSLAAVHLAVQALIGHECDVALAGGVTVRVPHGGGYLYQEGSIFSSDGHCRPFDARATGTTIGSGAGVVVLKRLADALADGDRVDAVVLGSALANDGSAKAGYTAPGVLGQARTIAAALAVADVTPDDIHLVEAHGTGTPLGDPIEIAALRRVFGSGAGRSAPCLVGSVKSNFGHLDSAAGITSFAKAVLELRAGEIAPSLNFTEPNPEIDFGDVFTVPTEAVAWPAGGPRRAGVSSFGFGGTNAHVVLQQGPAPAPTGPDRDVRVLVLSARDATALDAATEELATAVAVPTAPGLDDTARTLQTGRTSFPHRRIAVVGDAADAAHVLTGGDPARLLSRRAPDAAPPACWLLPGQGSQHPGMGAGLYRTEPVFRDVVDVCADAVRGELGETDLRALIAEHADAGVLTETRHAQPALFTVEVALAALLRSWGVAPAALLGHSVGELAAAHLAGVIPLADAARIAAVRGRLMHACAPGAMAAVGLPADALTDRLTPDLAVAAVNGPELSVVSGPVDAVDALAAELRADGVSTRPLRTSHAFHSPMMAPAAERLADAFAGVRLSAPHTPVLSNLTGTWLTDDEAADPRYWARQVLAPVRFADAVARVVERFPGAAWIEAGPGTALTALVRTHPAARGAALVPVLGPADDPIDATRAAATAAGRIWLAGIDLDWSAVDGHAARRRVPVPGHRLRRDRHWIDADPATAAVPAHDVPAEHAPATPTPDGDRPELEVAYREPSGGLERAVASIWSDLLGIGVIGADDPFLELGGHSLLAIKVVQRIEADLGAAIPLRELVHAGTVAEVAALAAELGARVAGETGAAPVQPATAVSDPAVAAPGEVLRAHDPFPLTGIQQAQWIGRQGDFALGNVAAHVYFEVGARDVDLDRLRTAWRAVERRHPMLDAVITRDGEQRITQDAGPYEITVVDLRAHPEADREAELASQRGRLSHEMRDIHTWPLYEIVVALLPDDEARVFLSFDLLIADIGSIRLLLRDWGRAYTGGPEVLRPLGISYRDYVLAVDAQRHSPQHDTSLAYWRERVGQLPGPPGLPLAARPADIRAPRFGTHSELLPQDVWARLVEQGTRRGLTPSSVLLAAYGTALGRWTRERRFTVNVTVTNRHPVHPDVEDLVGEFASFDLLPVDLGCGSFTELARALRDQSWADLEHRHVDGVEVLRELARGGVQGGMPVVFTSTLVQQAEGPGEALLGWLGDIVHEAAQTPQVWLDGAVIQVAGGVYLSWLGIDELFPEGLLDAMLRRFVGLVHRLADGDGWDEPPVLPLPQADRALVDAANDTSGPVPDGLLGDRVWRQIREHPDRVAVVAEDAPSGLSFADLGAHAADLGHRLRELGVGPGQYVAVACPKGAAQIAAVLGAHAGGGAYLPLDPDLPPERLAHLLDRADCRVAITTAAAGTRWPDGVRVVEVDLANTPPRQEPPHSLLRADDPAYVIFTSGSTGEPKGVVVSHTAALNTCVDVCERYGVGPDDAVLGLSSLSFDLSVWDVFGALGAGAALVLPGPGDNRAPQRWLELVREHRVTVWNTVPALAAMFTEHVLGAPDAGPVPIRVAMMSGDWIPVELPERWRAAAPGVRVVSMGGATEAAIWSVAHEVGDVDPGWDSIPYGTAMRNQTLHVLDDAMDECAVHVTGELYIGGVGVAEGYLGDTGRTAERFVVHPRWGTRLYRTGDLGRWRPEGFIEFLGREDGQVKVGGYRIELGEVEAAMVRHPGVAAAVAAAPGDRHHRRLLGYVVAEPGWGGDEDLIGSVADQLREHLPAYLLPQALVVIDALPLTANGKVDRAALPDPAASPAGAGGATADPAVAEALARIVGEVLGVDAVDLDLGFLTVGGDSIRAVQVAARATAEGLALSLQDLFEQPSLRAAAGVAGRRAESAEESAAGFPLTAHQRGADRARWVCVPLEGAVTADAVTAAATALLAGTPALRLRRRGEDQVIAEPTPAYVPVIDLSALPVAARDRALAAMLAEMADELDPGAAVAQAVLFELGDAQAVYWLAHEFAADAASLPLLAQRTAALLAGGPPPLPSTAAVDWLRAAADRAPAPPAPPAPPGEPVVAALGVEETSRLAALAASAHRAGMAEICLAALSVVLEHPAACQIRVEARSALPGVEAVDHIGPFTLAGSLTVPAHSVAGPEALHHAKSALRSLVNEADGPNEVSLGFHFAGVAPLPIERTGPTLTTAVVDGALSIAWNGPHDGRDAARLTEATLVALRSIAEHCATAGWATADAADFPLAGLSDGELAEVMANLSDGAA
ncbi:amino acid adenylation domain-containing protein [Actinokineospora guangxiensis]|uniref:Phenyloxazoline synthase MbtB n=1 Tax=Actinokineospora guangxiensis TaxID=1490288 RepID=A0ABW0EW02_9PSEU